MSRAASWRSSARRPRFLAAAYSSWAVASFLLALLPPDAGGPGRALNAVLFLTLGPAGPTAAVLGRRMPPAVIAVIAIGVSLSALVLLSQALLVVGWWAAWRVAGLVALLTIGLAIVPVLGPITGSVRRSPPARHSRTRGGA